MSRWQWGSTMKFRIFSGGVPLILLLTFLGSQSLAKPREKLPPRPPKTIQDLSPTHLQRLDPHGDSNVPVSNSLIEQVRSCQLCHSIKEGARITEPLPIELCLSCHNPSPHSGVLDHRRHEISCLDCHEVHRSKGVATPKNKNRWSSQYLALSNATEWVVRSKPNAMIKKDCKDCHH